MINTRWCKLRQKRIKVSSNLLSRNTREKVHQAFGGHKPVCPGSMESTLQGPLPEQRRSADGEVPRKLDPRMLCDYHLWNKFRWFYTSHEHWTYRFFHDRLILQIIVTLRMPCLRCTRGLRSFLSLDKRLLHRFLPWSRLLLGCWGINQRNVLSRGTDFRLS